MKYARIAWACPLAACLLALPAACAGELKMTREQASAFGRSSSFAAA